MAVLKIPIPQAGKTDKETIQNLLGAYARLARLINEFIFTIDSDNVTEINTNITRVKSNKGTTEIKGPVIEMRDMQDTPVLRLKAGYDTTAGKFVFSLMDTGGNTTFSVNDVGQLILGGKALIELHDEAGNLRLKTGLDEETGKFVFVLSNAAGDMAFNVTDTGQLQLLGKPIIQLYDDQDPPVLRLRMGFDEATGKFVYNMYDETGAETIGITPAGKGIITGGSIIGGKFYGTDLDSAYVVIGNVDGNLGNLALYRGTGGGSFPVFRIADNWESIDLEAGDGSVNPLNFLRSSGENTYPNRTWDCDSAEFKNLYDDNGDLYATRAWASQKGHTHTVTIDGVTYTTSSD